MSSGGKTAAINNPRHMTAAALDRPHKRRERGQGGEEEEVGGDVGDDEDDEDPDDDDGPEWEMLRWVEVTLFNQSLGDVG